ncbi:aminoglycoside phosphotransferase family protein [Leisingera sp. ANG59]|uniref:aminoglycoside phosphotransferase family protein n=1 Tax=Leisingera sp. ANG59 TaxID=2675221 RepID=UPI0020C6495A|nr:aminoglycoside phosphotransferase family protein [Leisingera sp. ANG59]
MPEDDPFAAMDAVQARTQALWPQAASAAGVPEDGAVFRRMQVNSGVEHRRCVLEVRTAGGRSFVLRADFESSNPLRQSRYLDRHQAAAESLKAISGVAVPELLWRDTQSPAALMEFVQGDTAHREMALTEYGFGDRGSVLRRIGLAVAALHRVSGAGERQFWPRPFLTWVSSQAQAVRDGRLPVPKPNKFLGLCAYLHRAARRARGYSFRAAVEHGDLHLRNILMSETTVSFIDFSNHDGIFPQRDLANLWLANCPDHLAAEGRTPGFGLVAQADWDAFQDGYGADLVNDPVFRFFYAHRLFRTWAGLCRKPTSQKLKNAEVAIRAVQIFDALLADEAD